MAPEDLDWLLREVPRWSLSADGKALSRKFVARNFKSALAFFNDAGEVAEAEGHHPDFHLTNYRWRACMNVHAARACMRACVGACVMREK